MHDVSECSSMELKLLRYLFFTIVFAGVVSAAGAQNVNDDAAKFVAATHLKNGLALLDKGRLEAAEKEFDLGIASYAKSPALFAARAQARYQRKNYSGVIEDLNVYLSTNSDDADMVLLRGIAKSLVKPEDTAGACADFLLVREQIQKMGVEKYCVGQKGW